MGGYYRAYSSNGSREFIYLPRHKNMLIAEIFLKSLLKLMESIYILSILTMGSVMIS